MSARMVESDEDVEYIEQFLSQVDGIRLANLALSQALFERTERKFKIRGLRIVSLQKIGITCCHLILVIGKQEYESAGVATLNPKDVWRDKKGNRVALTKAMDAQPKLRKAERKLIWEKLMALEAEGYKT